MQGWFPHAQIDYSDPALPITVRLNAFSPLVPHNVKDSSLPAACLDYVLTNPTRQPVRAALLLAWPNLLGWGGRKGTEWNDLSGDSQTAAKAGSLTGLRYTSSQTYSDQRQNALGEDFVGVRKDGGIQTATCASWDAGAETPAFWASFAASGTLPSAGHKGDGAQPAGAVTASLTLQPGESRTLHFYVVWAMPHMLMVNTVRTFTNQSDSAPARIPSLTNQTETRWTTGARDAHGRQCRVGLGARLHAHRAAPQQRQGE